MSDKQIIIVALCVGVIVAALVIGLGSLVYAYLGGRPSAVCTFCRRVVDGGSTPATATVCPDCLPQQRKERQSW